MRGAKPLAKSEGASATVSFGAKGAERLIKSSPFWRNLRGKELGAKDIEDTVRQTSCEDREILATVYRFKAALSRNPLDCGELASIVAVETVPGWGDFSQAAKMLDGDYGLSTRIRYQGDGAALVKLLPNVQEPFLIEEPQLIEGGHEIVLVKRGESWRIWAMR